MSKDTYINDSEHIARLWHKVHPVVGTFIASAVSNRHDVEDLLQDVAVAAIQDFHKFDPDTSFLRWTLAIARNRVLNYRRKKAMNRHVFNTEVLDCLAEAAEKHDENMEDRLDALGECIARLQGKSARVLEMRYMRDEKPGDIAKRLGMTCNAVFVLLHRTRKALEKCIKRRMSNAEKRG